MVEWSTEEICGRLSDVRFATGTTRSEIVLDGQRIGSDGPQWMARTWSEDFDGRIVLNSGAMGHGRTPTLAVLDLMSRVRSDLTDRSARVTMTTDAE